MFERLGVPFFVSISLPMSVDIHNSSPDIELKQTLKTARIEW